MRSPVPPVSTPLQPLGPRAAPWCASVNASAVDCRSRQLGSRSSPTPLHADCQRGSVQPPPRFPSVSLWSKPAPTRRLPRFAKHGEAPDGSPPYVARPSRARRKAESATDRMIDTRILFGGYRFAPFATRPRSLKSLRGRPRAAVGSPRACPRVRASPKPSRGRDDAGSGPAQDGSWTCTVRKADRVWDQATASPRSSRHSPNAS